MYILGDCILCSNKNTNRGYTTRRLNLDVRWQLVYLYDPRAVQTDYPRRKIQSCLTVQWVDVWRSCILVSPVMGWFEAASKSEFLIVLVAKVITDSIRWDSTQTLPNVLRAGSCWKQTLAWRTLMVLRFSEWTSLQYPSKTFMNCVNMLNSISHRLFRIFGTELHTGSSREGGNQYASVHRFCGRLALQCLVGETFDSKTSVRFL